MARRIDPSGALVDDPVIVADSIGWDGAIGAAAFSRIGDRRDRLSCRYTRAAAARVVRPQPGAQVGAVGGLDAGSLQYPSLSKDGRRLASDRTVLGNRDLYVADLGTDGAPARLTFDANVDATPVWSPDGTRIVFRSSRKGVYDLYVKASNFEATESPFYISAEPKTPSDWSPDGRHLGALHSRTAIRSSADVIPLWALQLDDAKVVGEPEIVLRTPADEVVRPRCSPDWEAWIAYQSNDGGPMEVYVQRFPGAGGKRQVSRGGGASPRWRRDGRELFYVSPDGRLMGVPIRAQGLEFEHGTPIALFKTRLSGGFGGLRRRRGRSTTSVWTAAS